MAKDVDLSSKEWTDIVFEGRNKEYGAYQLRSTSTARHNKAMLFTILGFLVIAGLIVGWNAWKDHQRQLEEDAALAALNARLEQEALANLEAPEEIEDEDENTMEQEIIEPEKEEALIEEILNTDMFTQFATVTNDKEVEDVKTNDEIKDSDVAIGNVDFHDGTDNVEVVRQHIDEVIVEEKKPVVVEDKVFESVEQMPQFPGGEAELLKWIANHIKYPTMAMENGVQGRVTVRFVVGKDGKVGEVKVARGKDPDLDKEAVRVVKSLPAFVPGRMNGQAVSVWYTVPINFKLQGQ